MVKEGQMFIYLWYILCVKKIQVEEDDWGQFVDLDE